MNRLDDAVWERHHELSALLAAHYGFEVMEEETRWGAPPGYLETAARFVFPGHVTSNEVAVHLWERWEMVEEAPTPQHLLRCGCTRVEYGYQSICQTKRRAYHLDLKKPEELRSHYHPKGSGPPRDGCDQVEPEKLIKLFLEDIYYIFGEG